MERLKGIGGAESLRCPPQPRRTLAAKHKSKFHPVARLAQHKRIALLHIVVWTRAIHGNYRRPRQQHEVHRTERVQTPNLQRRRMRNRGRRRLVYMGDCKRLIAEAVGVVNTVVFAELYERLCRQPQVGVILKPPARARVFLFLQLCALDCGRRRARQRTPAVRLVAPPLESRALCVRAAYNLWNALPSGRALQPRFRGGETPAPRPKSAIPVSPCPLEATEASATLLRATARVHP